LKDIHDYLRHTISSDTIIVGHSMDTDFKVLQLIHHKIIDTACLFPHTTGLPYKHSLKKLAKDLLQKDIQESIEGHDSIQDALTALELLAYKLNEGIECDSSVFPERHAELSPHYTLFERLQGHNEASSSLLGCKLWSNPMYLHRMYWERHGLGYRKDSNLHFAHQEYLLGSKKANEEEREGNNCELEHFLSYEKVFESMKQTFQSSNNDIPSFLWADIGYDSDHITASGAATEASSSPPLKRSKPDHPPRELPIEIFNKELEGLYETLPAKTLLLVLPQKSLATLRYLISKKLRYKWDNAGTNNNNNSNNNNKAKRSRAAIFGKDHKPLRRLCIDWDNTNDEPRLLEEANQVAKTVVFMKYKL